jgi:hypothetical protein
MAIAETAISTKLDITTTEELSEMDKIREENDHPLFQGSSPLFQTKARRTPFT